MADPVVLFIAAYDAWAGSPDHCAGDLFEAMVEARSGLCGCEELGEHQAGCELVQRDRATALLRRGVEVIAGAIDFPEPVKGHQEQANALHARAKAFLADARAFLGGERG